MEFTNEIEDKVRRLLEGWGYAVTPIQTAQDSRRADYLATRDGEKLVVEVTSKSDDGQYLRDLSVLGEALDERRITRKGTISRALHGKNDQLRSTPVASDAIRIVWIEVVGPLAETIAQQIEATFYGRVSVPVADETGTIERYCYFFDHASCYSLPLVNAVVVSLGGGGRFLINPVSEGDLDKVYATKVARLFKSGGGLVSPFDDEDAGVACSAHDFSGDRRDERAICQFLEEKYDIRPFIPLRWNAVRATKQVSKK